MASKFGIAKKKKKSNFNKIQIITQNKTLRLINTPLFISNITLHNDLKRLNVKGKKCIQSDN